MAIQKEIKYYVRIDKKTKETEVSKDNYKEHLEYLEKIAAERIFLGGGFTNTNGGMMIFEAKNLEEANSIAENDPLFKSGVYNYGIFEWEIIIASDKKRSPKTD